MEGCQDLPGSDNMMLEILNPANKYNSELEDKSTFSHNEDNLDTITPPSIIDDRNNETAADDGSDDDDDTYDANDLEIFADGGPSSSAHSKKTDKTKWCEREVLNSTKRQSIIQLT